MKKNNLSEPNVLQPADSMLPKNLPKNIPVFLILALCIFAVTVFSNQFYLIKEKLQPASPDIAEKYVWISGSPVVKEGLYLLNPEQLQKTFPELLPLVASPGSDFRVSAIQYNSDVVQPVNLPPAVASIFFQPISINRAEKEILSTLPGIGPMLAEKIVLKREANGPFRSKDELLHITGIGPKKLAMLLDYIILD